MKQLAIIKIYIERHELCGLSLALSHDFDMPENSMLWLNNSRGKERRLKTGT